MRTLLVFCIFCATGLTVVFSQSATPGLIALYEFEQIDGSVIRDTSEFGAPNNLIIKNTDTVRRSTGAMNLMGTTDIRSATPPVGIMAALQKTNEISIEAWVTPANNTQEGPARILTLSRNTVERNFTLGQEGDRFDMRINTTRNDANGLPSLEGRSGSVQPGKMAKILFTRNAQGTAQLMVNGKLEASKTISGDFSKWDLDMHLGLGNEATGDRPWQGTLHRIAIYDRVINQPPSTIVAAAPQPAPSPKPTTPPTPTGVRVSKGLLALYDFQSINDQQIQDRSGGRYNTSLKIDQSKGVRPLKGGLEIIGKTAIHSKQPAHEVAQAIRNSNAVSIEAWVKPGKLGQEGPARIFTFSNNTSSRNFTLGQDENNNYDVRMRTTRTDKNGSPSLASKKNSATTDITHVGLHP